MNEWNESKKNITPQMACTELVHSLMTDQLPRQHTHSYSGDSFYCNSLLTVSYSQICSTDCLQTAQLVESITDIQYV